MWWIYILKCSDHSLYTGSTKNLAQRVQQHNQGRGAKFTRSRRPVELVYSEIFPSQSDAMKREHQIKQWPRQKKLDLIQHTPLTEDALSE